MPEHLKDLYCRHRAFAVILLLFVSFRLLAILLFRPGGFITDFSDYDFYYAWGQLAPMGYRVFDNLWTAYPPLFAAVMLPIFDLSSRIPPWIEPRFFFHTLFGLTLLLFETGNLLLIYRLARRLQADEEVETDAVSPPNGALGLDDHPGLEAAILYALLFVPVYTLIGWFEPMPLFFMLIGLDLLLSKRRWGWAGSAIAAALGFLTKLTPALLLPIAIRRLGAKLSWHAARHEWFNRRSPGNLLRPALYVLLFALVVVTVGYPIVRTNPDLALSSFRIQGLRPPWQSLWALLDGHYGFGLVPLDMRNLIGLDRELWSTRLPWNWITLAFLAVYLWLYTRRYDWTRVRTSIAFAAVSVIWLFLYSKGWSPQFLVWILAFIVLLLPTGRGIILAVVLSLVNFVEANVFLIMLPDEHWIMAGTVLIRTALLLLLAVEFLSRIWPARSTALRLQTWGARLSWSVMLIAFLGAVAAAPAAAHAYQTRRFEQADCREAVEYLRAEAEWPNNLIVGEEIELWRDLHPWLGEAYRIQILDTYSPIDRLPAAVLADQLDALADEGEYWWIERERPSIAGESYFPTADLQILDERVLGACRLGRIVPVNLDATLATYAVDGGPIGLVKAELGDAKVGADFHLVLYWKADSPVSASYTVFTQLFDDAGHLVAQRDNLPVEGLAPTDTWTDDRIVRDPYRLAIPAELKAGDYRLLVGLYDENGRREVTMADGTRQDHIAFPVRMESK